MNTVTYSHDCGHTFLFFRRRMDGKHFHYEGLNDSEAIRAIKKGEDQWLLVCTLPGEGEQRNRYYPVPRLREEGWANAPHYTLKALERMEQLLAAYDEDGELIQPWMDSTAPVSSQEARSASAGPTPAPGVLQRLVRFLGRS